MLTSFSLVIGQSPPAFFYFFLCRIHLWFRWMGGLQAKSMTSQRYRATYKMADMRYYGNVMTTTRWRLYVILHLQQYSLRLKFLFLIISVLCFLSFLHRNIKRSVVRSSASTHGHVGSSVIPNLWGSLE